MFLSSTSITAKHGFFGREGGHSTGNYASLNCGLGSGDELEVVEKNRDIVRNQLGAEKLVTCFQTHSDIAHYIKGTESRLSGDALITDKPGIALGVLTADCAPILLHDAKQGVIAAAHAGWKGARFGIIGATIRGMQNLGCTNIVAAIGPCIGAKSYEVGADFAAVFASEGPHTAEYFEKAQREGHFMFNLPAYVKMKLLKNGAEHVDVIDEDTLSQPQKYYSYRKQTLDGASAYGRQISAICL
jgi:YfiH family protein